MSCAASSADGLSMLRDLSAYMQRFDTLETSDKPPSAAVTSIDRRLSLRIPALVVLVLSIAPCTTVPAADSSERRSQYVIYATSQRHTDAFNKYAYFVQELAATRQRYLARKEDFIVYEPVKSGDPMDAKVLPPVPRQRSLDEVMKAKAEALQIALRPTDYSVVKLGMGMLPVPSWMATAGEAALHLLPEFNDRNPQLARSVQDKAVGLGYELAQGQDLTGELIRKAGTEWIGASPAADFSDAPPVQREKEYRRLLAAAKDNQAAIAVLEAEWKSAQEKLKVAELARLNEEEFQRQRAEVLASFELAGYAARVLGDRDLELAFNTMGFAAERISTLTHNAATMGSAALTAGYVGLALSVADMVSNYGKPDPTAAALAQISAQIESVREEMHERFDRVDEKLNLIWAGVMGELASLRDLIAENDIKQTRELQAIRAAMTRHGERLIGLTYELEGSTRRLEAGAAQVRRSQAKVLTDRLLRGSSDNVRSNLENINLELSSYLTNELSKLPFADDLANFPLASPEQRLAVLTSTSGGKLGADGIDLSRGLQVLLVERNRLDNRFPPPAGPDPSSWIELATDYLAVIDRREGEFPELRSGSVIRALDSVGGDIETRLATLFGNPADRTDTTARKTIERLAAEVYSAIAQVNQYLGEVKDGFEKDQSGGVSILGELDLALSAQHSLPGISTGSIAMCASQSFCDVVADHYKRLVCKTEVQKPAKNPEFGPLFNECHQPEQCEKAASQAVYTLPAALLTDNVLDPVYLVAYRLGLVTLRTCWQFGNYLPGEEALNREERRRLAATREGYRILVRAEHADLQAEFVTARHVVTPCQACDGGLLESLRSKDQTFAKLSDAKLRRQEAYRNERNAYIWGLAGGARDSFNSSPQPEVRSRPHNAIGRFYAGLTPAERKKQAPIDSAHFKALFDSCFASPTPPDEKTSEECFPKERIDPYLLRAPEQEDFYYGRFWMRDPFLMSPAWRITSQKQTLTERVESKRRDLRKSLVTQLRTDATDGRLGTLLTELKLARLKLHIGLALGYQDSLVMKDELRELIFGNRNGPATIPRSEELLQLLSTKDADYRQVESLMKLLNKPSDEVLSRIDNLGAPDRFQPLSQLLSSVKLIATSASMKADDNR